MACAACVPSIFLGSWLAGMVGYKVSNDPKIKLLSSGLTTALTLTTMFALKTIYGMKFCENGELTMRNIIPVLGKTVSVGVIYSFAITCILSFLYPDSNPDNKKDVSCPSCKKKEDRAEP